MFAISQVLLNTTGAFKNINQISTYSIITGLVLYASIYLYLLFYNEEYVNIFNKFVIYVIMIDLLLSIFYYFNIKKSQSQNKILAENPLGEDVDETEGSSEGDVEDLESTESDDVNFEGDVEDAVDFDVEDAVDFEDDVDDDVDDEGDIDFEGGGEGDIDFEGDDEGDDEGDVEDAVDFEGGDEVEDDVAAVGSSEEIFCPNDVEDDVIDIRDVEAQAIPNANELSFLEEPVKQKPKRVYKKKAVNLN
jgi:hypothetical protein